jgi:hypothetical protein
MIGPKVESTVGSHPLAQSVITLTVYVDEDSLFGGLRTFNLKAALRDVVAGVTLASASATA